MNKKNMKIMFIMNSILILIVGLYFGSMYNDYQNNREIRINQRHQNLVNNVMSICSDKDLEQTAYCLRDFVNRSFNYYYVEETETMSRSFLDIYEEGGDCLDYSILYSRLADNLGYESEIIMDLENEHAYVKFYKYSWDKENYCILDLVGEPECFIQESEFDGNFAGGGSMTFNQDLSSFSLNPNQER